MNRITALFAIAATVALTSCSSTEPAGPGIVRIALALDKITPISATVSITIDSLALKSADSILVTRGASAAALTDTVFLGAAMKTVVVFDSNGGKWFAPGSGRYYRVSQIRTGAVVDSSTALAAVFLQGDNFPFKTGSVWVYRGYATDTITGAKKNGTDYTRVDSLVGPISFQNYTDVYAVYGQRFLGSIIALDTSYYRLEAGDVWKWERYGVYPERKIWQKEFRFGTAGSYMISDTLDTLTINGVDVQVHEVAHGTVGANETISLGNYSFTGRSMYLRLGVTVTSIAFGIQVIQDTLPTANPTFAPGFGIVQTVQPSFTNPKPGFQGNSLPKAEGWVETLVAVRIKY